jgi:hypothetical protein
MKLHRHIILSLAALGLFCASSAFAQDNTAEFVQMHIERTDLRIEQAAMLAATIQNDRADLHVTAAMDLQGRAKDNFANTNYDFALRLTTEARGHAERAIAILRNLPDPERVKAQIERTQELLERAKERIEECNNDRGRAMLRAAFEMQKRAIDSGRNGQYLVALQLTVGARERALKALRLCNLEENLAEGAERQIERTENIVSRASEAVQDCASGEAKASLGNAQRLLEQARDAFRQENYRAALKLTRIARRAAYRALTICKSSS